MHTFTIALSLLLGSAFTSASDAAVKPTQTIPASCTTTSRHALVTHSCYTATAYTTRIGGCERLECPPAYPTRHVPPVRDRVHRHGPVQDRLLPHHADDHRHHALPEPLPGVPSHGADQDYHYRLPDFGLRARGDDDGCTSWRHAGYEFTKSYMGAVWVLLGSGSGG
ncbi:hypothetical protein PG996_006196 [Apiospora saccharicola]|uniref:Uncharacterized protein n=1 Tax=Apiospora saccharicola TaxID=335842 RepID=A0ABR1VNS3_9PEZI